MLKERVKLVHSAARRISHELIQEVKQRLVRQTVLHEGEDAVNNVIVNKFTLVANLTVGNLEITLCKSRDSLSSIEHIFKAIIPTIGKSFDDIVVVSVVAVHGQRVAVDDNRHA